MQAFKEEALVDSQSSLPPIRNDTRISNSTEIKTANNITPVEDSATSWVEINGDQTFIISYHGDEVTPILWLVRELLLEGTACGIHLLGK